jgi:predicted DNA-binding transcriptional regulator YafY
MSLAKARDLMRLAEMAAARHQGISLAEIAEEFRADHRMARALEDTFPAVEIRTDEDRRRRWKLRDPGLARLQGVRDDELAALEMSIRRAEREGRHPRRRRPRRAARPAPRGDAGPPRPPRRGRRRGADGGPGLRRPPGPAVRAEPGVLETIAEALKAPFLLAITYAGPDGAPAERRVAPHGVLLGMRRYLVARDEDRDPTLRHFRVDRIDAVFDAERAINGLDAGARLAVRRAKIAPLVADLEAWMGRERAGLPGMPQSPRPWTTC